MMVAAAFAIILPTIPPAHASGPTTVATLGGSYFGQTYSRPMCISNGYDFVFYSSAGANTIEDYQSSPNGVTWAAAASTGATPMYLLAFTVYCDPSSSNIFMAWSIGNSFDYLQATTSGGVITPVGSAATIACTHGTCGSNGGMSIYCFDSGHCGVVMSSGSTAFDENWLCATACATNTNWADKLADSTNNCAFGCNMFGMDANNHWCSVEFTNSPPQAVQCTTNGGTSWSTFQTANNYNLGSACAKMSSTTIGCGQLDSATHTKLYFNTFIIGTGAWTETQETTITAINTPVSTSTDASGNVYLTWIDSSTTGLDQLVSSNSGSTWTNVAIYVSGEATALYTQGFSTSLTLVSGAPAVCWLLQTSNNLRCGANGSLPIVTTTTTIATTVTATATAAIGQVGGSPANATTYLLATNLLYGTYTQNPVNSPQVISNVTMKVANAKVKTAFATLRIGIYMVSTPGQVPSSTYPLQLQSPTFAFQIVNASGVQFVHVPTASLQAAQITICGSCYYGIGVVADSNGSRPTGFSGVTIYGASFVNQVQIPNLQNPFGAGGIGPPYQPGWASITAPEASGATALPSNWYTYPGQPRNYELALVAFGQYSITIVVRAGSTTTVTTNQGTITNTVTVSGTTTLTTTTEDAVTAGIANNALLYVLLATMGGLFFVGLWAGGLGGGIFGAIIGIVIGIASGIITGQYATISVVATLIGAMAAIQLGRSRRGGFGGL